MRAQAQGRPRKQQGRSRRRERRPMKRNDYNDQVERRKISRRERSGQGRHQQGKSDTNRGGQRGQVVRLQILVPRCGQHPASFKDDHLAHVIPLEKRTELTVYVYTPKGFRRQLAPKKVSHCVTAARSQSPSAPFHRTAPAQKRGPGTSPPGSPAQEARKDLGRDKALTPPHFWPVGSCHP